MSITLNGEPGRVVDIAEFVTAAEGVTGERMVAVAVSDLDGLAALNEAHGAEATIRVLAGWQRTLSSSVPDDAVVARISGDEWAVAMPGASAESALIILEEIRAHYTERGIAGVDSTLGVSIGVSGAAAARPEHRGCDARGGRSVDAREAGGRWSRRHLRRGEDDAQEQLLLARVARPARRSSRQRPNAPKPASCAKHSTTCSRSTATASEGGRDG